MTRTMIQSDRFDVSIQIGILSGQEDICDLFKDILNAAGGRLEISGLEQSAFSYDIPQDGFGEISGYLHVNKTATLTEAAVRTWITDDPIDGEVKWSPVLPGRNGNWKQHALINSIFAACKASGNRRLQDWVGKCSDAVEREGRPRKLTVPADRGKGGTAANRGEGSAAADAGAQRPGRQPRPQPVAADSELQAALRARLRNMLANSVSELCSTMFSKDRSWVSRPKHSQKKKWYC